MSARLQCCGGRLIAEHLYDTQMILQQPWLAGEPKIPLSIKEPVANGIPGPETHGNLTSKHGSQRQPPWSGVFIFRISLIMKQEVKSLQEPIQSETNLILHPLQYQYGEIYEVQSRRQRQCSLSLSLSLSHLLQCRSHGAKPIRCRMCPMYRAID